jgi:glycosyltransferase involved in cell wall biosynthesis
VRPLGWVDDLDSVLGSAAALVSPLRIGSGTKIKVLEALARGLPVVATPHGVLGLGVGRAEGCLVESTPAGLAAALAEVADPGRNAALSAGAAGAWARRFSPAVAARAYDDVCRLPVDRRPLVPQPS